VGRPETSEELTYPEWIELLGMTAFVLADPRSHRNTNIVTGHGEDAASSVSAGAAGSAGGEGPFRSSSTTMLQKIRLLFYNMYEAGARFSSGDPHKMIRAVTRAVHADVDAAQKAAEVKCRQAMLVSQKRVADVLGENIVV